MTIITDIDSIGLNHQDREPVGEIDRYSRISVLASVQWRSERAAHTDEIYLDKLNTWRDFFPPGIEMRLAGSHTGDALSSNINGDEFIPSWSDKQLHSVRPTNFDRHFRKHMRIQPRAGRFYPRGIFSGIPEIFISNMQPCRLVEVSDDSLVTDFNHPLARFDCTLEMAIVQVWSGGQQRGGRCNDIVEMCTTTGPGMQARWHDAATDFAEPDAFARDDESPDGFFYGTPRMVHHMDAACRAQITGLYAKLLPAKGRILDLMSSWVSHLPDSHPGAGITGLGMNRQELDANPALAERIVHDLNSDSSLPFEDASFDAVVCTASVEYLTSPFDVFRELARVLKPGAPVVMTFSNRWFPPKTIRLWPASHDFEHMGLVSEYLVDGGFDDIHTWSLRNLPRPQEDKYADRLLHSDPVFAVWAYRP